MELKAQKINAAKLQRFKVSGNKFDKYKEYAQSILMVLPQTIGFLLFSLFPMCWVIRYGWFDFDGVTERFVGFDNFVRAFHDQAYWKALFNTFIITFGKLSIELPLALLLAIILNSKLKGRSFFRTIFYMPNIISVAISGVIFSLMFGTFEGIVNNMLIAANLVQQPVNWFGSKWTAMSVLMVAGAWQYFGINMLLFLSALQNIPAELYECAQIDGAGKMKQFFKITIPMLSPVLVIIFMLSIIGSMQMTDLVLVLTNGNPAGETEVVMTYIFRYFFNYGTVNFTQQAGYGSALGLITALILGIFTIIYLRLTKKASTI